MSSFADVLDHLVERDGLTEKQIPMNARCGLPSKVIDRLTCETRPSLSDLRNGLRSRNAIRRFSAGGLVPLVRT